MPKPPSEPKLVTAEDITQVVSTEDDFGFELRVGAVLRGVTKVAHAGTYTDPVEGKPRQFDYRAEIDKDKWRLSLAIECKNLSPFAPMVVCHAPRDIGEAYSEVISSNLMPLQFGRAERLRSVFYERGKPVGKNLLRVTAKEGIAPVKEGDSEIYKGWSQALASSSDLIRQAYAESFSRAGGPLWRCVILPIVVVPDGTLWQVDYDESGRFQGEAKAVSSCFYFVGSKIEIPTGTYTISHIHFLTISGLDKFLEAMTPEHNWWRDQLFDM